MTEIDIYDISGYRIVQSLGQSRQTDVLLAEQLSLRRHVTLKILRQEYARDPAEVNRFITEAKTSSTLNHPAIVQVYDVGDHAGLPYITMEYIIGPSIEALLLEKKRIAIPQAIELVRQIADGLASIWATHRIAHRHLSPKSIYLDEEQRTVKLVYTGFSMSTLGPDSERDGDCPLLEGAHYYMAPERFTAPDGVDFRADIYGMGATLYHMITGVKPFGDRTAEAAVQGHIRGRIRHPQKLVRQLPPGVGRLLEVMLMKDPERRYSSWAETQDALRSCLNPHKVFLRKGTLEGSTLSMPNAPAGTNAKPDFAMKSMTRSIQTNVNKRVDPISASPPDPVENESPVSGEELTVSEMRFRLLNRERVVGTWIQMGHPASGEILAEAGFDWVAADMEHTDIGIHEFTQLARGVYGRGAEMWARVRENDTLAIRQVLDAGAQGVIIPLVNSVEDAERAVAAARFPPQGVRGYSYCRANDWGSRFDNYAELANTCIAVVVMIESREACDAIEDIMSVEGVDGAFIGPYDLSGSYGVPGQTDHPDVLRACERVSTGCAAMGKSAGLHVVQPGPDAIKRAVDQGFNLLALGMDTVFIAEGAQRALAALRGMP
ncbi:MAG: aldolase/citrate lyase family protein [Verrucomicrobia bacterium]|nr:aldolase/citrate lyase family protein [Verrucomicrobiota bacterium]